MRFPIGATPCLLLLQAAIPVFAQTPITFAEILSKARPAPELQRVEARQAEHQLQLQESRGFLREGPSLSLQMGPRRNPLAPTTTDKAFELDLPLFLSPGVRRELETLLGQSHPLLQEAAHREGQLKLRAAYLNAWLAAKLLSLREADLALVERWKQVTQSRFEAGSDPEFQVALVEGERLQVQQELDEAHIQQTHAWSALTALAELPPEPQPLADPGALTGIPAGDLRLHESPLRKALLAQVDLEERSLRLKESLAQSRWSLRASHAQEGEEKVTRIGLAVRLPRPGEGASQHNHTEAQIRALKGEARQALAELDARSQSALARLRQGGSPTTPDFSKAMAAVELRLQEGRERPSEALPIRRQLLAAQMASLRAVHAQHLLHAELQALMPEVKP